MTEEVIDLGDATPAPPPRYSGTYVDCVTPAGGLDFMKFYAGQRGSNPPPNTETKHVDYDPLRVFQHRTSK